jgi:hypothetical protein
VVGARTLRTSSSEPPATWMDVFQRLSGATKNEFTEPIEWPPTAATSVASLP